MPLYAYTCTKCSAEFETLVNAANPAVCPSCGGTELERHMSRTNAEGPSKKIIAAGRARAAAEGHVSNYSKTEMKNKL
jgi:putative FmdB family regulatory protein